MKFPAKLSYLVDTHQARDHRAARAILCPPKVKPVSPVAVRLPYADN